MPTDTIREFETTAQATLLMTREQADRWNDGESTDEDWDSIVCLLPSSAPDRSFVRNGEVVLRPGMPTTEKMSLRECEQTRPRWFASMIEGQPVALSAREQRMDAIDADE